MVWGYKIVLVLVIFGALLAVAGRNTSVERKQKEQNMEEHDE
jgi:hypothetical protein